jgi:hypothetical protein
MKETKPVLGQAGSEAERDQASQAPERQAAGIRLLDDYELVLAGGGDHTNDWP